jgi:Tfp pilus assembly protein PilN
MNIPFLNLLPPDRRRRYDELMMFLFVKRITIFLFCFFICVTCVLVGAQTYIQNSIEKQRSTTAQYQSRVEQSSGSTLDGKIRDFNTLLSSVQALQKDYRQWTPILLELSEATPTGVTLSRLEIDGGQQQILAAGAAATRTDLLDFVNRITASPHFDEPASPISNLLQRENISFEIRFGITP